MDIATGSEMFKSKLSRDYSYGLTKSAAGDVSCKIEFEAEGVCIALVRNGVQYPDHGSESDRYSDGRHKSVRHTRQVAQSV